MNLDSKNNGFFHILDKISLLILGNLLWVALSLPIVTMPMATIGLFSALSPWVRGKDHDFFKSFFSGMKESWGKSIVIMLLNAVTLALVILNLFILSAMDSLTIVGIFSGVVSLAVASFVGLLNLYIWPLMVMFDNSLKNLLALSIKLAFSHLAWSMFLLIVLVGFLGLLFLLPAIITPLISVSICVLWINWGTWRIMRRYIDKNELAKLEFSAS